MNTNQIVKPKIDVVFKKLFGDPANEHILKAFIADMLGIDKNRITEISFDNVEMIPDFADEKFGKVDVKVTIDNKDKVNIELQAVWFRDYKDRSLFYWSKLYTYGLKKGKPYGTLSKTICINIVGFNVFKCEEYKSHFTLREVTRNEEYSDKMGIYFYELNKLPPVTEDNQQDPVLQWLRLINAETEDDLNMLENSNIPEIKDAVEVVKFFSGDEQVRLDAFEREMAIRDHLASIAAERQDGNEQGRQDERKKYEEVIKKQDEKIKNQDEAIKRHEEEKEKYEKEKINNILNMLSDNISDELIIRYTGVTSAELAEIKAIFYK